MGYQFYNYNEKDLSPKVFSRVINETQINIEMPDLLSDLSSKDFEIQSKALRHIINLFNTGIRRPLERPETPVTNSFFS